MGKKKHNYVNVPSTAETDEIMNDNLLSDDFGIYIRYGPNLSTNPGILFLKGLQRSCEF